MMIQMNKFTDSVRLINNKIREDLPMGRADGYKVVEVRELAK